MIREVEGDILLTTAQAIVHGVAANDNFATGLALSLREMWPAMYKDFRHYCQSKHPAAGSLWVWGSAEGKKIISLFTQESAYGHGAKPGKASVPNVNHALAALHKIIESEAIQSLAIPRLATGVGGLDWNEVRPLIQKHLGELKIPIFIYTTFKKGVQAKEA